MKSQNILVGMCLGLLAGTSYAIPSFEVSSANIDMNGNTSLEVSFNEESETLSLDFTPTTMNVRVQSSDGPFFNNLNTDAVGTWASSSYTKGPTDQVVWSIDGYVFTMKFVTNVQFESAVLEGFSVAGAEEAINDEYRVSGIGSVTYGGESVLGGIIFDGSSIGDVRINFSSTTATLEAIPEPSTIALLGLGLVGLVVARKRQI